MLFVDLCAVQMVVMYSKWNYRDYALLFIWRESLLLLEAPRAELFLSGSSILFAYIRLGGSCSFLVVFSALCFLLHLISFEYYSFSFLYTCFNFFSFSFFILSFICCCWWFWRPSSILPELWQYISSDSPKLCLGKSITEFYCQTSNKATYLIWEYCFCGVLKRAEPVQTFFCRTQIYFWHLIGYLINLWYWNVSLTLRDCTCIICCLPWSFGIILKRS